jgi:hypothetical protein
MIRFNSRRLSVVTLATTLLAAAGGTLAVDADRKLTGQYSIGANR